MSVNYFTFDGTSSLDFNVVLFDSETDDSPEKIYETTTIAGKDGIEILDEGRYDNIPHVFNCLIYRNCEESLRNLRSFLQSKVGYKRLEDSLHPDEFYIANSGMPMSVTMHKDRDMAKFQLSFDRKPRRYLKSGETAVEFTESGTILNPSYQVSKPLIRAYGAGSFTMNGTTVTIATHSYPYIDIDSEMMDCYYGSTNANGSVTISTSYYPRLISGMNNITIRNLTRLIVTPRWYVI